MIEIVAFKAEHLKTLLERGAEPFLAPFISPASMKALESQRYARTAISGDRVIACAGIGEYWPNRGEAWAFIDPDCTTEFLSLHRAVKKFLDECPIRRIEASVDIDFPAGHRWMNLLKFRMEALCMRAFLPDGRDCSLYARVK